MKPDTFERAVRLQFDCLARKVIGRTVKNYNKELARRAKREIAFCDLPDGVIDKIGFIEEYSNVFTTFDVFGTEVRIYDESLCEAIKQLSERRRTILLMSYFLEMPDCEISDILEMARTSVYRNRMQTLKLIKESFEKGEFE
ncbi:sigma factor-like helix-turn-helix DNA-binding protein [Enterococcus avium]|uniref:sigma factor-like helix-turn-helix DNA-binding protein n=1 Tax=Enterococcus avium TaxID=33945 RepID=UPI0032E373E2